MIPIKAGTTDVSAILRFLDSTDGTPELGVSAATTGLVVEYRRELGADTAITPSNLAATTTAHSDGGFIHIGDGYYRIDLPDAACASSSGIRGVLVHAVATSMVGVGSYLVLTGYDPYDTVRAGLTALPNAAADAAGGLPISDAGGLDMDAIGTNAAGATSNALVASSNALVASSNALLANTTAGQASSNALVASSNALLANTTAGQASSNALVASSNALVANATAGQASSNALVASSNALVANSNVLVVDTVVDSIQVDTDDIQTRLPAALVSGRMDASVGAVAANAITAAAIADGAIDRATLAADTGLQSIRSNTAQAGASTTLTLDSSASASDDFYNNTYVYVTGGTGVGQARFISDYNGSSKIATVNAAWVTNPSSDSTFAIIAFSTIPGASAPTAAEVADAVWDEAQSGHTIAGSFGAIAEATNSNALLASTNAGTASSNALVASSNALLANTAASAASSNALVASSNALLANTTAGAASSNALVANSNALVVLADTNDIQTRLPAALVGGRIDASVGAVASDAITASAIAANAIGASELAADAVAEIADAVWDEALSGHTTGGSAGKALRNAERLVARDGTAQAGSSNSITLDASASAVDDFYVPGLVALVGGTGLGQFRRITAYNGSSKVATVATLWATNPDVTSEFQITPWATVRVTDVETGAIVADSFAAGAIDAAAIAANAIGASELAADAVAEIADAVWEEAQADHTSAGTFGIIASEIADILVDTGTTLDAAIAVTSSNALVASSNALLANTNALAAGSNALVASSNALVANATAGVASSNALVANSNVIVVDTVVDAILVDTGTTLDAAIAVTNSNALLAAANALVASSNALVANSNVIVVDTVVDAILVDTGTTLQAEVDGIQADTEDIQTRLPAALVSGRMDSTVSAINNVTTAAARIARSTQGIVLGTVGSASTTSNIVTSSLDPAAAASDQLKGRIVTFEQGTTTVNLRGQSTDITASTPAGALTVTPLTTAPVSGDVFIIT